MREIKFRGKSIASDEWVYGSLLQRHDSIGPLSLIEVQDKETFVTEVFHVYPNSVGQFTGQKDSNTKDIYEGNKVNDRVNNCIVEWDGREAKYKLAIVYDEAPEGICQTHKPFPLDATGLTIIS